MVVPNVKEQVAYLQYHEENTAADATQARVSLLIGEDLLQFGVPRPAAGTSGKSALWYCEWKPKKT